MSTTDDWRVELDVFNGPMDLLLYLIKRDELDIFDVPIARVTRSYIEYLDVMRLSRNNRAVDIDTIGDFLVMAATLMEIKSATLLPTPTAIDEAGGNSTAASLVDPRAELIRQLLEYKRFKDHAAVLDVQKRTHDDRFPRYPATRDDGADVGPPPLDLDEVQVWDLLAAFTKLMGEIGVRRRVHEVVDDDTPIDLHAADIEDRLTRDGAQTLRQLFASRASRSEIVGVFLALLELIREKRVVARFAEDGDDVAIELATDAHRRTFRGAGLHASDGSSSEPEIASSIVAELDASADER